MKESHRAFGSTSWEGALQMETQLSLGAWELGGHAKAKAQSELREAQPWKQVRLNCTSGLILDVVLWNVSIHT